MNMSRRKMMVGASSVSFAVSSHAATTSEGVADLAAMSTRAYTALMKGDAETYAAIMQHTQDFTLMQPFGGKVIHGFDMSAEHLAKLGGFFKNGDFKQELIQSISSGGIAVLVTTEHQSVEVGGLAKQQWPLRVTLVFRRESGEWKLAHRHADPLVLGIPVKEAAAIARGDVGRRSSAKP
jgi:ketosteroid isomerase-like protein